MNEPTPTTPAAAPSRRPGLRVTAIALTLAAVALVPLVTITPKSEAPALALPVSAPAPAAPESPPPVRRPQVVKAVPPGEGESDEPSTAATSDEDEGPERPSDEQVERELREFREALRSGGGRRGSGGRARLDGRGEAIAPAGAPETVLQVIEAGNRIAKKPYIYGGGHGGWRDKGYDCSGSVSFALAGAGLLDRPMASGGFMRWGAAGEGRWITIYSNPGHMFMVVAGLRFDTSGQGDGGTRWQEGAKGPGGYEVRHPPGL